MPPIAPGFVRITVQLKPSESYTPGDLARLTGLAAEHLGPMAVQADEAILDVPADLGRQVRERLESLGATRLVGWEWQWVRLQVGRNHGLSIGQLRKVMQAVDALPLGRIAVNNTHTLVGLQDFKIPAVVNRLSTLKINGFAARPEVLPPGKGPGPAAYIPR